MTTSGVYSFSVSRDDIIRDALLNIRKLDELEVPTAQETVDCSRKLNMLVKQWQGTADFSPGLKTWTRRRGHLFLNTTTGKYQVGPTATGWTEGFTKTSLTASAAASQPVVVVAAATGLTNGDNFGVELSSGALFWSKILSQSGTSITLATNLPSAAGANAVVYDYTTAAQQPIVIETATLRDSNNEDVPLTIIRDVQTYEALPSKADNTFIGDPTAIYYEFQLGNSFLFTDVGASQDVTKYICISYLESQQDFVNPTDTPEYPQEWYLALSWGLAKQIAPMYGATWSPTMQSAYIDALAIAQRKGPEVSMVYFQCGEIL